MATSRITHLKTSFTTVLAVVGAAFIVSVCLGDVAQAQPAGGNGQGGKRPPPQEALAACKSLASGAACSFTTPQGNITGSCWAPQGMALACKPKDAPASGGRPAAKPGN